MVQYTSILVASAIAATVPALAAPFAYLGPREIEDVDIREPMFKAAIDLATHGPARRVITAPLKKTANDAIDRHNHPLRSGPGPAQAAMNKILQEQKSHGGSKGKRNLEDFEDLDAREPMFKAAIDLATHGPARRVITAPLKKTVSDAVDQHNHPLRAGPGPAQAAMNKILQEQKSHGGSKGKRSLEDLEDLDAREPMFKAITDLATHGPARRVITEPLKKTAHDAIDQHNHPLHSGPGPAQAAMNRIHQEQKAKDFAHSFDAQRAAAHAASRGKRELELEDLLERDFFDLD